MDLHTLLVIVVTAALTTGLGLLASLAHDRKKDQDAKAKERATAYVELATAAFALAGSARNAATVVEYRSSWSDGLMTAVGRRPPADLEKLAASLTDQFGTVFAAYTRLGVHAKQDASDIADELMGACSEVINACTQAEQPGWARFKWTAEREAQFNDALRRLSRHRIELIKLARIEAGQRPIVFAIDENSPVLANIQSHG